MIADDDPVVRSMLGMALGEPFQVVGVVGDTEAAVELARARRPEAALVDVDMPRGGGLRAVQGILETSPDTAIVILSGDESDGVVRELIQAGATAYCRKGVSPHQLIELLMDSISAHSSARSRRS